MSFPIKTNRIEYSIDRKAVSCQYDFFCVSTSDNHFSFGAQVLDTAEFDGRVKAVLFERGNSFLLMANAGELSLDLLQTSLKTTSEADHIMIRNLGVDELSDQQILQLLMNALGNYESSFLRCNNLTGHLYCVCPAWIKHGSKNEKHIIWQIPCLELHITEDFCLDFPVRTFSSVKLRSKMTFNKRKFSDYPRYILTGKNTLRRQLNGDNDDAFILRQLDNQKSSLAFMSIKDIESFNQSKMGLVLHVVETFNKKYDGFVHIAFCEISEYESIEYTRACAKAENGRIEKLLKAQPIHIVDTIGNEDSERFCETIRRLLKEKHDIHATIGKRLVRQALNIRVIHNQAYYDGLDDPHKTYVDTAVQHITFEDFSSCAEFAIETVIHELLIKQDLVTKEVSLFSWKESGCEQPIAFGLPAEISGQSKYVFITIFPDGHFDIEEEELDLFHIQQYQDCVSIFEDAKTNHENVIGLVRFQNGEINVIKDTGWVGIPEIEKIRDELAVGNTKIRGKEAREELLSACLDVKSFYEDKAGYYFVGTIGNGMRNVLNWATNIRRIEPYKDAPLMYKELLPMMNVTFVRNGQLTVAPFPFKYLREYISTLEQ